jgi:hypothetical protein
MNERILKLAEQAGLSEGVFTRHNGVPCDLKGYSMTPEQMEKFAELIVQECINQCANAPDVSEDWYQGVKWVANEIAQHFGVEL